MPDLDLPEMPRLAPGVRLHLDKTRGAWVLLCPEKVIEAEGPASDILKLCDGTRRVDQIIDELAVAFVAERSEIASDVREMLSELAEKGLLVG